MGARGAFGIARRAACLAIASGLAGSVHAACDVAGGGPVVNDSVVTCSGTLAAGVVAPDATGVSVTVVAGTTMLVGGAQAIRLGDGAYVVLEAGSLVSGVPPASTVQVGRNSVVESRGTLSHGGGVNESAVSAGEGSVVAIHGTIDSGFGSGSLGFVPPYISLVYPGAIVTGASLYNQYLSSAGRIKYVALDVPLQRSAEFYNEPGGQVLESVIYTCQIGFIGNALATFDSIIVNRGYIGPNGQGFAVWRNTGDICDMQFTNTAGAVVEGTVRITRSYDPGRGVGTNAGTIDGEVWLAGVADDPSPTWGPAPLGFPQSFTNSGFVRDIDVQSGDFIQAAAGSFDPAGVLKVLATRGNADNSGVDDEFFLGRLLVSGTQLAGCLTGVARAQEEAGGTVVLQPGAALTIAPPAGQTCVFDGTLEGQGRFVKSGAGTQVLGAGPIHPNWTLVRPPTTYAGGSSIAAGTLAVTRSDALGTGAISFTGAGARLRIDAPGVALANPLVLTAAGTFDTTGLDAIAGGATSGAATLTKDGTGTLTLGGTAAHGATTVAAGVLRVTGNVTNGIAVSSGATLAGSGTIGAATLASGATLRPSSGTTAGATLSMGALALAGGSTLRLAFDGANRDRIAAGSAALGGATLALDVASGLAAGTTFTIVEVAGAAPATGSFAALPEAAEFQAGDSAFRISYAGGDGNDVVLTSILLPLPPFDVAATPGDAQISLAFTQPAPNAAGPITGYRASCAPGDVVALAAAPPIVVTGLANATSYQCSVRTLTATAASVSSNTVSATPLGRATAPSSVVATPANASFSVSFGAPANDGGFAVQQYRLACTPGGLVTTGSGAPLGFTGLANGTTYSCELAAQTSFGLGHAAPFAVTPRTVPDVPVGLVATPYNESARFSFAPPAFDGGSAITSYTVRCPPGVQRTVTGAGSPLTLTGLSNGTTYGCWVRATNAAGNGPTSAEVQVTPLAVPSEVRNAAVVDGSGGSAVSFDPPTLGAPILDYAAACTGGAVFTGTAAPLMLVPLANYSTYTCAITARNALGSGPPVDVVANPVADCAAQGGDADLDSICDAIDPDDDNDGLDDDVDPCPGDSFNDCPASAPTALAQALFATQDTALPLELTATDPDGDRLRFDIVAAPLHGTIDAGASPLRTYTPAPGFAGDDIFQFSVNDGDYDSPPATIRIQVRGTGDVMLRDGFED